MSTTPERVHILMTELGVDQPGLGAIAGASKSVVNQWLSGLIKKIGPKYAYNIEKNAGYSAEWVMFGTGDKVALKVNSDAGDYLVRQSPATPYGLSDTAKKILSIDDQKFVDRITDEISHREIPDHLRQIILSAISSSPEKK